MSIALESPTYVDLQVRTPENKKTSEISDVFLSVAARDDDSNEAGGIKNLLLAGTEGANSNTSPLEFEVTETLIQELVELAYKLRRLGVYEVGGKLYCDEDNL